MRPLMALAALGLAVCGFLPAAAQAQVIIVGRPVYSSPPVVVSQSYYAPPVVTYSAPPVVTYSAPPTVSYYSAPTVSYYTAPTVSYYSAPPVVTYSAPVAVPATGYYSRSYYGFGIFRPRGWTTETYYYP